MNNTNATTKTNPISLWDGQPLAEVVPTGSIIRVLWRRGHRPHYWPLKSTWTYVGSNSTHHELTDADGEWVAVLVKDVNGLEVAS